MMEAKDLMVGDWVKFNLYPFTAPYTPVKVSLDAIYKAAKGADVLRFEPIPLTPEILEANGFRKEEFKCGYGEVGWFQNEGCTYLTQNPHLKPMFTLECTYIEIEYVHQLQHVLRLCGLIDLADNFKIE